MRIILHVDMDAFYASVEQLDDPRLLGKPVIVGADPREGSGRGVVAACSYEARKFGVHSAMPISRAWRLCPEGCYVRPRMARYVEVSHQVMDILRRFSDLVEPLSIDEAFLDVTGSTALYGSGPDIARKIKADIRQTIFLTASVGVAPNKFLAKIASELRKPDGLVCVDAHDVHEFLRDLPAQRLWGVGPKTAEKLRPLGIRTIGDIAAMSKESLVRLLGSLGDHLHQLAHGLDERPVVPDWEPKSISNETTFERDTNDRDLLLRTIHSLADEVGRRLRHDRFRARRIILKLRYEDFSTYTRQQSLDAATQSNEVISRVAIELFNRFVLDRKIRLLGVGTADLVHSEGATAAAPQLALFAEEKPQSLSRDEKLGHTLDEIRSKFGRGAVRRASHLLDDGNEE